MFDYIRCEVPLPDGWNARALQTKDLGRDMAQHVITKEGRLMLAPPYDERIRCGPVDANFHGMLRFYGSEALPGGKSRWHEYRAKFTDGQLVGVELVPDDQSRP
jgi:hypothetical protein